MENEIIGLACAGNDAYLHSEKGTIKTHTSKVWGILRERWPGARVVVESRDAAARCKVEGATEIDEFLPIPYRIANSWRADLVAHWHWTQHKTGIMTFYERAEVLRNIALTSDNEKEKEKEKANIKEARRAPVSQPSSNHGRLPPSRVSRQPGVFGTGRPRGRAIPPDHARQEKRAQPSGGCH